MPKIMFPCKWIPCCRGVKIQKIKLYFYLGRKQSIKNPRSSYYTTGLNISSGPYPNVTITLKFEEFSTECSYDYVFIYDGDSYLSPLIGAISGKNLSRTLVAHSGQVTVVFTRIEITGGDMCLF